MSRTTLSFVWELSYALKAVEWEYLLEIQVPQKLSWVGANAYAIYLLFIYLFFTILYNNKRKDRFLKTQLHKSLLIISIAKHFQLKSKDNRDNLGHRKLNIF